MLVAIHYSRRLFGDGKIILLAEMSLKKDTSIKGGRDEFTKPNFVFHES